MSVRDSAAARQTALDPATSIGSVALRVSDLGRSRTFYTEVLGMRELGIGEDGALQLGGPDGHVLLSLLGDPDATPRHPSETGLFHFAVLVPSRRDLAWALYRLARARVPLSGASDHLVSEALYLNDPDGNGIEIYRDKPRAEWTHDAAGQIEMATLPLDLDSLLGEVPAIGADGVVPGELAAGTVMGHVHLQVSDIPGAERFYAGVLGFDVTVRTYPGALFVSAGGYHHHIGLNTWNSRGGALPGPHSVGLRYFEIRVGSGLAGVLERLRDAGYVVSERPVGALVADPAGNGVLLRAD